MTLAHILGPSPLLGWVVPVVVVAILACLYGRAALQCRRRGGRWNHWRTASFLVGLLLVGAALSPNMEMAAEVDPTAHMVQHLLLGMYAPMAIVLAAPFALLLRSVPVKLARKLVTMSRARWIRWLTHPFSAGAIHVGGLFVLYLTPLYAATTDGAAVHHAIHAHFLLAGCLFAWSIAGPDPVPHRPAVPTRVVALILSGGAHAALAKFIYSRAGTLPPGAEYEPGAVERAAQLMYYGGDVAEVILAVALFAWWYRRSRPFGVEVRLREPKQALESS